MRKWMMGLGVVLMGCGPVALNCTEMGCNGTIGLLFEEADLADGSYQLTLDVEGDVRSCSFDVPVDVAGVTGDCQVEVGSGILEVLFFEPMGAAPASEVSWTLEDAAGEVASGVETPVWDDPVFPNGEECDGEGCSSTQIEVVL